VTTAPDRLRDPRAILVVDLAFGDCGKGTIVDFLARRHADEADGGRILVVRFNGGPQAGHNVVAPDGRHHTFSQLGSGTFVPGAATLLSRHVLIEPYALLNEAAHLRQLGVTDALRRLHVDARCPVITPAHQAANRLRELLRGAARAHGTCGLGIVETMQDLCDRPDLVLRAADLADAAKVGRRLRSLADLKWNEFGPLASSLRDDSRAAAAVRTLREPDWIDAAVENYRAVARTVRVVDGGAVADLLRAAATTTTIFEGAQGVLVDENVGFHPHTTWSTTTFANADALLDEANFTGRRTRLGILRTYFTRHGAGPFVSEDPSVTLPEPHNDGGGWQGRFRAGPFDAVAARYALAAAGGVDAIALTHLDRIHHLPPRLCTGYRLAEGASDDDWFVRGAGGVVTDLRPPAADDFTAREHFTDALRHCRPAFAPVDLEPEPFVARIEHELRGTAVALTSWGPTASDKRLRRAAGL
jgi:adenylosuccinate synthase